MELCETRCGRRFTDHAAFHEFSVSDQRQFWLLFLEWSALLHEGSTEPVCTSDECEHAVFFPNLRLNYAENLLRVDSPTDAGRGALVAHHAFDRPPDRLTRGELRAHVFSVAAHLRELGIGRAERVVAVAGNNAETVIAGLATALVGATFSSAAPDMGVPSLLSRFEQLRPSVLMASLLSNGTTAPRGMGERIEQLVRNLPSLTVLIALDEGQPPAGLRIPVHRLSDLIGRTGECERLGCVRFPFNQPLSVLFSSGTTGRPKCLVHGAGGTLLEHSKEHRLHVDLKPGDRLFFHTSAAWMMWNWQLSALACGAELVLYDGPVSRPETLWELVSAERVNVFGTNPPYLQLCEDSGFSPRVRLALPDLRAVLSTGAILHDWQYDWVREHVGPVALQSISGGTDIIGCFVLGHPDLPVRRGLIQCRSLGLDVQAMRPAGSPPASEPRLGELVCRNPFPSRPLGFYEDDGRRFHAAYFEQNPGMWTHGDLIEFDSDGQARMHGRSDGVLNVRGARIGPDEIYQSLRGVSEISKAMAVERGATDGESEIVLLVVLRQPAALDSRLVVRIRREIARNASAAHVPALVAEVDQLPSTHSGKLSERAARDAVNGRRVENPQALTNPESLELLRDAVTLAIQQRRELEAAAGRVADVPTEARLRSIWEAILGVALRSDDNFFELGGTSLTAVRVLQAVHQRMGIELPPAVFVHAQTTAEMAAVIDGPTEQRVPTLVLLRPGTGDRPVFLVHPLAGDVLGLQGLALRLDTARSVYGLQARGLDPRQAPQTRVEEMADTYLTAILSEQAGGPFTLAGYSFGGLVAFEIARRLIALGEQVDCLALIDTDVHHACLPALARWKFVVKWRFRQLSLALAAPRTRMPEYMRKARGRIGHRVSMDPHPSESRLPPRLEQLTRIGWEAFAAYRPGPYGGSATLFLADVRRPGLCNPLPVWSRVVRGGLTVERIAGDHVQVVKGAHLVAVADRLSELFGTES